MRGEDGSRVGCVCRDAPGFSMEGTRRGGGQGPRRRGQEGTPSTARSLQGGSGKHRGPGEVRGASRGCVRSQALGDPLRARGMGYGAGQKPWAGGYRRHCWPPGGAAARRMQVSLAWGPERAGARPQRGAREGPSLVCKWWKSHCKLCFPQSPCSCLSFPALGRTEPWQFPGRGKAAAASQGRSDLCNGAHSGLQKPFWEAAPSTAGPALRPLAGPGAGWGLLGLKAPPPQGSERPVAHVGVWGVRGPCVSACACVHAATCELPACDPRADPGRGVGTQQAQTWARADPPCGFWSRAQRGSRRHGTNQGIPCLPVPSGPGHCPARLWLKPREPRPGGLGDEVIAPGFLPRCCGGSLSPAEGTRPFCRLPPRPPAPASPRPSRPVASVSQQQQETAPPRDSGHFDSP